MFRPKRRLKNKTDKYLRRAGSAQMKNGWPLDKPMASLSICQLVLLPWMAILLNQEWKSLIILPHCCQLKQEHKESYFWAYPVVLSDNTWSNLIALSCIYRVTCQLYPVSTGLPANSTLYLLGYLSTLPCIYWATCQPYPVSTGLPANPTLYLLGYLPALPRTKKQSTRDSNRWTSPLLHVDNN